MTSARRFSADASTSQICPVRMIRASESWRSPLSSSREVSPTSAPAGLNTGPPALPMGRIRSDWIRRSVNAAHRAGRHPFLLTERRADREDVLSRGHAIGRGLTAAERNRFDRGGRGGVDPQDRDIADLIGGDHSADDLVAGVELHFHERSAPMTRWFVTTSPFGIDQKTGGVRLRRPDRQHAVLPLLKEERRVGLGRGVSAPTSTARLRQPPRCRPSAPG